MADYPIIFSAAMVRALLDGRKTMTRRLALRTNGRPSPWQKVKPGDRLWVREGVVMGTHSKDGGDSNVSGYLADGYVRQEGEVSRPSIHMPRWASRLTLVVTATKVEPLQAISAADAEAEGVTESWVPPGIDPHRGRCQHCGQSRPQHVGTVKACFGGTGTVFSPGTLAGGFAALWASLHGADSWDQNPDVVALTFRAIRENIDRIKEAA